MTTVVENPGFTPSTTYFVLDDFSEVTGSNTGVDMDPGFSPNTYFDYENVVVITRASFGGLFTGFTVVNDQYGQDRPWEVYQDSPSNPLTLSSQGQYLNVGIALNIDSIAGVSSYATVNGVTYANWDRSFGEGAICVLFANPQKWVTIELSGLGGGGYGDWQYRLKFFDSSANLLGTITKSNNQGTIVVGTDDQTRVIAGFSLENSDPGGLGITEIVLGDDGPAVVTNTVTHLIDAYLFDGARFYDLYYINKDPETVVPYARYITDILDLDSNNFKHIKQVYTVGDYGNNTITLKWTKTPDYSVWNTLDSKTQSLTDYGELPVWRNLCHARRFGFMIDWSGNSNITHEDIEVSYNIKTQ